MLSVHESDEFERSEGNELNGISESREDGK